MRNRKMKKKSFK